MSEKVTFITLHGAKPSVGLMDWGECAVAAMVQQMRRHAAHLRSQADQIDAAADGDFRVTVERGPHVRHHLKTLQEGRR